MTNREKKAAKVLMALALASIFSGGVSVQAESITVNSGEQSYGAGEYGGFHISGEAKVSIGEETENSTFAKDTTDETLGNLHAGIVITNGTADIKGDVITFSGITSDVPTSGNDLALSQFAGWQNGNSTLSITANELYVGSEEKGTDRGFQFKNANNTLNVLTNKLVAYVGDGLINAQGIDGSVANFGTSDHRIDRFEAYTTYGKDDFGVAILQANEGNTINVYANTMILDGSTNEAGGVIGSGSYGTVNIDAKDLTIDGNICGSYGTVNNTGEKAEFNIKADTLKMTGDINIGSINGTNSNFSRDTILNLDVKNAVIDGDVNVYGNEGKKSNDADESKVNLNFAESGTINGTINIDGQTDNREAGITLTGQNITLNPEEGKNAISIAGTKSQVSIGNGTDATDVTVNGKISVTDGATATFADNTVVKADSTYFSGDGFIYTDGGSGTVNLNNSEIVITNIASGTTGLKFSDSEELNQDAKENVHADTSVQDVIIDNNGNITLQKKSDEALAEALKGVVIGNILTEVGNAGDTYADLKSLFFTDGTANVDAANSAANLGELAGLSHSAYSVSNLFTDSVSAHLEKRHDSDVWAQYIHNKESVDSLGLAGVRADYDATYDGIVAGIDLVNNDSFQGGVAFTYTNGSISGSNGYAYTENDADYYGISLYGRKEMAGYALLGDVTYLHGSNDITQWNDGARITASPDVDAISLGVKALKDMKAGNGTITPYIGARYLRLNTESYTSSLGMHYDADSQNLFLIPVGVNYSTTIQNGAWSIRPVIGVGYVWNLGDRTNDQTVSLGSGVSSFSYDTTDAGSLIAKIGIGAEKGNYAFGVGYEYQDGSTVSADKWTVSAAMRF